MKRLITLITLGLSMLSVSSCIRDNAEYDRQGGDKFLISYSVNTMGSENKTRATVSATEEEETVQTLHLFFFQPDANRAGSYVDMITIDGNVEMNVEHKLSNSNILVTNAYNIIAIANVEDYRYIPGTVDDWVAQMSGYNERQFSENIMASVQYASGGIASDLIPMSGNTTKAAGDNKIDLTLTRVVSRLDILNNVHDTYPLKEASVWNAYYKSSLTGDGLMDYTQAIGLRTMKYAEITGLNESPANPETSVASQFYVFENQVISPENGDRHTTCIIVGLFNSTLNQIRYYRVNIHPDGSPQNLKRNNSYTLTITGVAGDGYDTEEDAYTGKTNELLYTINYWDLDDNGLIVSDINSILAIPTKTIRMGALGTTNSYTITTFSRLENPNPLSIKNVSFQPSDGSITASLSGNTLSVTSQTLPDGEPDRTGIITLSYADLEASINVIQSSSVDKFLNVTLDDGFTPRLAATAKSLSEYIYVNASGPWTAKVYGATPPEFSLDHNSVVTELKSGDLSSPRFRVSTIGVNDGTDENECFVLISLDDDPLDYVSVVALSQKVAGSIIVNPAVDKIEFDGMMNLTYPASNTITVTSATGDNLQTIANTLQHFNIVTDFVTSDNKSSGTITVTPKSENHSGLTRSDDLVIEDDGAGEITIKLYQSSTGVKLNPTSISERVPATGGETEYIEVQTGAPAYSASVVVGSTNGDIFNHEVLIELEDGSQTPASSLTGIPSGTRFRVVFPKIYYPNREKEITATVTVQIDGAPMTATIAPRQTALTSQGINVWSSYNSAWGSLHPTATNYFRYHNNYFHSYRTTIAPGSTVEYGPSFGVNSNESSNRISDISKRTYIHFCNYHIGQNYEWNDVTTFMETRDGITVIMGDDNRNQAIPGMNNSNSPLKKKGYVIQNNGSSGRPVVNTASNVTSTRIYKFFVTDGKFPITGQIESFYIDGHATGASAWPSTAVPIVRSGNNANVAVMAVDPANGMIFFGDCTIFIDNAQMNTTNKQRFMWNYVEYVCLSAMYGSHFMDLFVDTVEGQPNPLPDIWDSAWGTNAWRN